MSVYDIKCRIIEEELKTFWPQSAAGLLVMFFRFTGTSTESVSSLP